MPIQSVLERKLVIRATVGGAGVTVLLSWLKLYVALHTSLLCSVSILNISATHKYRSVTVKCANKQNRRDIFPVLNRS